jgi:hypothetical protein
MNDGQSDESPAYYIDTDNLRAFLGDDIGVNPTGSFTSTLDDSVTLTDPILLFET